MRSLRTLFSAGSVAVLFAVFPVGVAQAQACPDPLPQSPPPLLGFPAVPIPPQISPTLPATGELVTYWFISSGYGNLDASSISIIGTKIEITAHITSIGAFPLAPPRCFGSVVGGLNAGTYTIKRNIFLRNPGNPYPSSPVILLSGPFQVAAAVARDVPAASGETLAGMLLLIASLGLVTLHRHSRQCRS
jgi:hypothetical protein